MRLLSKWDDYSGGPRATDDIAHECVRTLGGYLALSQMSANQLQWQEKRFREHYEDILDNPHKIEMLKDVSMKRLEEVKMLKSF